MKSLVAEKKYRAVVMGVSAGGINALLKILPALPVTFSMPVIIVQHRKELQKDYLTIYLNHRCRLKVEEAKEKCPVMPSIVYLAPPGYHLLIERDFTFSLSVDPPVNFSRPSIDVLFESAAVAYRSDLIGVILTGANCDGSLGLKKIRQKSGLALVQDPKTAENSFMPLSAINTAGADHILPLDEIGPFIAQIGKSICSIF